DGSAGRGLHGRWPRRSWTPDPAARPAPPMRDVRPDEPAEAGPQAHLEARLAALEDRVRDAVDRRRALDPKPDDPFRGLYLSSARVEQLLSNDEPAIARPDTYARLLPIEAAADAEEAAG